MKRLPSLVALVSLAFAVLAFNSCSSVSPSSGSTSGSTSGSNSAAAQGETTRLKLSNKLYRPIVVRLERLGDPGRRDITVSARSSESVKVKPGTYKYSAVAEGFRPISKYKELEAKRSYTLYF
ncbi:hypothetical protein N9496_00500 [Akkermansiaceae bacterium]|nr:hypothetical protein [Akkermansiaceae bacterium]